MQRPEPQLDCRQSTSVHERSDESETTGRPLGCKLGAAALAGDDSAVHATSLSLPGSIQSQMVLFIWHTNE